MDKLSIRGLGYLSLFAIIILIGWFFIQLESASETESLSRTDRLRYGIENIDDIELSCFDNHINNTLYLQCFSNSWGRWEVFHENPMTGELTQWWYSPYNDSTGGGPITTNPGRLVITFFHKDGRHKIIVHNVESDLKLCIPDNLCTRVFL